MKKMIGSLVCLSLLGCRGQPSSKPPFHWMSDMDWQPKYQPQEANVFFPDGMAMRPWVEGTVARGMLQEEEPVHSHIPLPIDERFLWRGQERYAIFCTPCHDAVGTGRGMVVRRGYPIAMDLTGDHVRQMTDGTIFTAMTTGIRNMPSLRKQIPVADRWAIVAWIRVLQRSQNAHVTDVPPDAANRIEPEASVK